ncbi:hypothetical protein GCM10010278_31370 [Streptomyces melanogenes]|nr:hypothetical protein GCM10010278_31370 [Streptomyces melanogenes]
MQTTACPAFSPDFLTSRKTMIASSTTAEIESATAVHLHLSVGQSQSVGAEQRARGHAESYPPPTMDHNYPAERIDRCTGAQGAHTPHVRAGADGCR